MSCGTVGPYNMCMRSLEELTNKTAKNDDDDCTQHNVISVMQFMLVVSVCHVAEAA